jgi:hypothetical protein
MPNPATIRVREFLGTIYNGLPGFLDLRTLPPIEQAFVPVDDFAGVEQFVKPRRDRRNCYVGVALRRTPGDGSLANCGALPALFADLDFTAQNEADIRIALDRAGLPPSIIVRSGGGLHPWWLLKEPEDLQQTAAATKSLLRRLAIALDGDLAAAEPARILRLPNTLNFKFTPPRPVTVACFEPDRRYNLSEFDAWLPSEPRDAGRSDPQADTAADAIPHGRRNATLLRLAGAMRHHGASEAEILATLLATNARRCRPPLSEHEVRQIVRSVGRYQPAPGPVARSAIMTELATIEPQPVDFVWDRRIPRGRVTIVGGDPGLGKSFVTLYIAACVSTGSSWTDGGQAPLGDVIVLSAEDAAADTIRPRCDGLGADVSRIHLLTAVRIPTPQGSRDQWFSLVTDLEALEDLIVRTNAVLVIIDPLSAYLGIELDSYKDAHVRSILGPLAALAERTNAAIVGIMHLTKNTQNRAVARLLGSIGFTAAARLLLIVAPHPTDDAQRVLVWTKGNICSAAPTLGFSLADGELRWTGVVEGVTADYVLAVSAADRTAIHEAEAYLRTLLADGTQRPAKWILAAAVQEGISVPTLYRAKKTLGIDSIELPKPGGKGEWFWWLR